MRRSLAKFSEPGASNHTPSLADFTTTTPELKFSAHTMVGCKVSGTHRHGGGSCCLYAVAAAMGAILHQGLAGSNCSAKSSNKPSVSGAPINCNPTGSAPGKTGAGTTIAGSPARLIAVENIAAVRGRAICSAISEGYGLGRGQGNAGEDGVAMTSQFATASSST